MKALKTRNEEMKIQIVHLEEMLSTKDVQIEQLKELIHEQKETMEKTVKLGCEVQQLQCGMEEQKKELKKEDKPMQASWTEVVKKGKKRVRTGVEAVRSEKQESRKPMESEGHHSTKKQVRKLWGMCRGQYVEQIKTRYVNLYDKAENLSIVRNFKQCDGKEIWWFEISGNESILAEMQSRWKHKHWKLEKVFSSKQGQKSKSFLGSQGEGSQTPT